MSVPEISEADRTVFNPEKVKDYLATSNCIFHDYSITGAELSNGKLYLTVQVEMYFDDASLAYDYLKQAFSLSDDTILALPEFAGCYIKDGYLYSESGGLAFDNKTLSHIPVSENATVELLNTDSHKHYEVTMEQFKEKLLGNKNKNDNIDIWYIIFEFSGDEITSIFQYQESEGVYEDEGYDE